LLENISESNAAGTGSAACNIMNTSPESPLSPALRLVLFTTGIVVTVAGLRLAATLLVPLALASVSLEAPDNRQQIASDHRQQIASGTVAPGPHE
jgi:hypothetical protein